MHEFLMPHCHTEWFLLFFACEIVCNLGRNFVYQNQTILTSVEVDYIGMMNFVYLFFIIHLNSIIHGSIKKQKCLKYYYTLLLLHRILTKYVISYQ